MALEVRLETFLIECTCEIHVVESLLILRAHPPPRVTPPSPTAASAPGVQEGGGGERHRTGPSESHALGEGRDRPRGLPLLLGHGRPTGLGE